MTKVIKKKVRTDKPVRWVLFCANPMEIWQMDFDTEDEFESSYEERSRWGELYKSEMHYLDGTVIKHKYNAWSAG